jgi:hypothetical protein
MHELDLSAPVQRVLSVKLKAGKELEFILRRVKIKDAKTHSAKQKKLTDALNSGDLDGLTFSYEMLKATCQAWSDEQDKLVMDLDDEQLGAIWRKVRELKEAPTDETAEKKT